MRRYVAQLSNRAADPGRQIAAWMSVCLSRAEAQGLVEYGLILVLIAVVCVGILTLSGRTVSELWYQKILDAMPG